jgi:hypothetical protein
LEIDEYLNSVDIENVKRDEELGGKVIEKENI